MSEQNETLNRARILSTSALSDALDSLGVSGGLLGCSPRTGKTRMVGFAFTVQYEEFLTQPQSFQNAGNYIDDVVADQVIVINNAGRDDCTSWGGILTEVALQRKIAGTVVYGAVRDLEELQSQNYSLFSSHIFMQSGKNRVQKTAQQIPVSIGSVTVCPGDLICGDASGVLSIPRHLIDEVLSRAEAIEKTEGKILNAIRAGQALAMARKEFGYHEPWKN